jgi:hypothetical protein
MGTTGGGRRAAWVLAAAGLAVAGLLLASAAQAAQSTVCTGPMAGGTVKGNLTAGAGCALHGTEVTGDVIVASNGSLVADQNAMIDHDLRVQQTTGAYVTICDATIGHDALIDHNSGLYLTIGSDSGQFGSNPCASEVFAGVQHDLKVTDNSSNFEGVANTSIGHVLTCQNDNGTARAGAGTTVGHKTNGTDCSFTTTTQCPSTGCDVSTPSVGGTQADLFVPGGGKPGNVTLSIGPLPPGATCGAGEGVGLLGLMVTDTVPAGYTASNPIVLSIEYDSEAFVQGVCKSKNGQAPFTSLPQCQFISEGPPANVPCFDPSYGFVSIYEASGDPSHVGQG